MSIDASSDFVLDASQFPLVRMVFPEQGTIESVDAYFEALLDVVSLGRFALIVDMRPLRALQVDARTRAHFTKKSAEMDFGPGHKKLVAEAVILSTSVGRMLLTAYVWGKQTSDYPTKAFASDLDAERWCRELLQKEGLHV